MGWSMSAMLVLNIVLNKFKTLKQSQNLESRTYMLHVGCMCLECLHVRSTELACVVLACVCVLAACWLNKLHKAPFAAWANRDGGRLVKNIAITCFASQRFLENQEIDLFMQSHRCVTYARKISFDFFQDVDCEF